MNLKTKKNIGRILFIFVMLMITYGSFHYLKYYVPIDDSFSLDIFVLAFAVLWSVAIGIACLVIIMLIIVKLLWIFIHITCWLFTDTDENSLIQYLKDEWDIRGFF